jgi:hypothetical protein
VAGAIQKSEYLGLIEERGFDEITIQKEKTITIPDDILERYLSTDELNDFKGGKTGIYSITVFAQKKGESTETKKPVITQANCNPGSGCC